MAKKTVKQLEAENEQLREQVKELKKGNGTIDKENLTHVAVSLIAEPHQHHKNVYKTVLIRFNPETGEAFVEETGEADTRREVSMAKATEALHEQVFRKNGV